MSAESKLLHQRLRRQKNGVPLSPEVARFMGEAGGKARAARMAADPELRSRMRDVALRNLPRERRVCVDCGKESSAPGMGNHLKASGHSGYERKG